MKYDFLVVGAGLFAAVFCNYAVKKGKKVLVLERRNHIGGNCYTENVDGIEVHKYGAHIFRTSNRNIWEYINSFDEFNNFINSPVACYKGKLFNLPFNMNTFYQIWGCKTPEEAQQIIEEQRREIVSEPQNLEEKAISLVGRDVYEILIKEYTEKQWGKSCKELPASILRRLPVRFTFDNNYFNQRYQGIPIHGYTHVIKKMFEGAEIITGIDFNQKKNEFTNLSKKVIYTGAIDELFEYKFGELEYRSLRFEQKKLSVPNYQGVAVMNFTDSSVPYTRCIEHKHFVFGTQENSIISYEFPSKWERGLEPYYPINDVHNQNIYSKYHDEASKISNLFLGGRLGEYRYFDMEDTIVSALKLAKRLLP